MSDVNFRPKYVTFDCFGTLINCVYRPVTRRLLGDQVLDDAAFDRFMYDFNNYRYDQVCGPFYPYKQVLHDAYARTCRKWDLKPNEEAGTLLAETVMGWTPHPNVVAPLKKMSESFPLAIISNADDSYLDAVVPRLETTFHAVYTAEQAGVYKPRYGAFEYMLDRLGVGPDEVLHISEHMRYDIMPADDLGFTHKVLLDRGVDPDSPAYNYTKVTSLDEVNQMLGL